MGVINFQTGEISEIAKNEQGSVVPRFTATEEELAAGARQVAEDVGPVQAVAIGIGKGLFNIGRGLGLLDPAEISETEAFEALKRRRPFTTGGGEIVGEALPFLPAGAVAGTIRSTAGRIAGTAAVGAVEGGVIAKSRGEDIKRGAGIGGAVAGGIEALIPIVGSLGNALIRRVTGRVPQGAIIDNTGRPTEILQDALDAAGVSFDDLTNEAINQLKTQKPGVVPEQAVRSARFKSLDAPATRGDITKDFAQQKVEANLEQIAGDIASDPLRALRLQQSRAFRLQLDSRINALGVPDDVGDSIKNALEGRQALLRGKKNELYKRVGETSEEVRLMPIITDEIKAAVPSKKELKRLGRIKGNQADAARDLLVEFGIEKDPELVENFIRRQGEIDPLNIGNFEDFRQGLIQIEKSDLTTRSTQVITGPIKRALDNEANIIEKSFRDAGITDENVFGLLKQARGVVRELKTEFSPDAIAGKLIKVKRDGFTPLIEASKVFNELVGGNKAPELVERVVESLSKSPGGKKAIGDLQAKTIVDLLNSAFKAQTRTIGGEKLFGGVAFNNKLDQIGERRLKAIFSTRPQVLQKIKDVGQAARDITPDNIATPKGSAPVILDLVLRGLGQVSKLPGLNLFVANLRTIAAKGGNRKVLLKALDAKPNQKKMATFIANDAPDLARLLGLTFLATKKREEEE